jgi:hypothetical protein
LGALIGGIVLAIVARFFFYSLPVGDTTDEANNIINLVIPLYGALFGIVIGGVVGATVWLLRKIRADRTTPKA